MPNPILPAWEYIPDGEPRVFGDRVYLYGSHDRAAQSDFCDYKLKAVSVADPIVKVIKWSRPDFQFIVAKVALSGSVM